MSDRRGYSNKQERHGYQGAAAVCSMPVPWAHPLPIYLARQGGFRESEGTSLPEVRPRAGAEIELDFAFPTRAGNAPGHFTANARPRRRRRGSPAPGPSYGLQRLQSFCRACRALGAC